MKIIFDHQIFTQQLFGGISRYVVNLCNSLNNENNTNCKIFAPLHTNFHLKKFDNKNKIFFPTKINFLKKNMFKINQKLFDKYIREYKPDIHHATYYDDYLKKKDIPKILTIHDLTHEKLSNSNIYPKQESISSSDHIICVSHSTKKDLQKFYEIDEKKISVIYESAGILKNNIEIKNSEFEKIKPYILYVGSRHGYKNWEFFIKAYSSSEYLKKNYNIVFFGGGKLTKNEIDVIKKQKILSKISFLEGSDQKLIYLYANCEAFIYPSLYEGFGLTLLEALSFKKKIICSDIEAFREVCDEAAIYFNPLELEDLKLKLEKTLMGDLHYDENTKNKILKKYSWKKCALETLDVYKKVL